MPDLIDSKSAIKSVEKELTSDQLRWKSLAIGVANGEPNPPARIVQRLGTAFDFAPEEATAIFLDDVSTLKKHRQLLNQQSKGETAMLDWKQQHESPEELKRELEIVQNRSVEIRTALSRHWQREAANSRTFWQINKMEKSNSRIFD